MNGIHPNVSSLWKKNDLTIGIEWKLFTSYPQTLAHTEQYGNMSCQVSKRIYKNRNIFGQKLTYSNENIVFCELK